MPITNGLLSTELTYSPEPCLVELEAHLRRFSALYVTETRRDRLLSCCPVELSFRMWATRIEPGGTIGAHYHPSSWITGVYYPAGIERIQSCLELGPLPEEMVKEGMPIHRISTEPNKIVCFPSFIGHRVPLSVGADYRYSIGFDLVAVDAKEAEVILGATALDD